MTDSRRALITGATGFVGAHLVRHLLERGHQAYALTRPTSDLTYLAGVCEPTGIGVYDGTLQSVRSMICESRPDIVFHLGSLFLSTHEPKDVDGLIDSNIRFGTHLVEAAVEAGVRRFINTGTAWQHFQTDDYNPVCLYAATKQAFEAVLRYYHEAEGLYVVNLKLFDTYGVYDRRKKLFNLLREAVNADVMLPMSAGEQFVDLVHIDDVVRAFALAGERTQAVTRLGAQFETFVVSSGAPVRLQDVVELFFRLADVPSCVQWGARPYRKREVMHPWSGGELLPGWKPLVSLHDGIRGIVGHD